MKLYSTTRPQFPSFEEATARLTAASPKMKANAHQRAIDAYYEALHAWYASRSEAEMREENLWNDLTYGAEKRRDFARERWERNPTEARAAALIHAEADYRACYAHIREDRWV